MENRMENLGKRAPREELKKALKENFENWGKAYEMLAAGEEPEKEEDSENELENE